MKKIVSLVFVVLCFMFYIVPSSAEEIKNFDSNITINKNGTIDVKEKIIYDFNTLQKHGIYRTIPYVTKNKEGKRYKMDFRILAVEDEQGQKYQFSQSTEGENLKLKIGDPNRTITGVHSYLINYQVSGALTYFSDHDELYWNVTGTDWLVPIAGAAASVELPQELLNKSINVACYTGSLGTTEKNCQRDYQENKIIIKSVEPLASNQGLTIVIGFPINVVARLEPKEIVDFWQTIFGKLVALGISLLALFWYLIYPVKIIYKWWRYGKDPKGQVGEVRAWFEPPKTKDGRELTPSEVGGLIDETVQIRDISAGIVDLARRGYLKIEERKKNDFWFIKKSPPSLIDSGLRRGERELLAFEKKLLNGLFSTSDNTRIKDRQLAGTVSEVESLVYNQLVSNGLFPKNPNSIRIFYSVMGVLALMTANFPLALIAFTFGRAMPAKTVFGVESANISKSLRNFLTSQQRQLEFLVGKSDLPARPAGGPAGRQVMFEKLLPFAVAFGVERIWAQRFKDINLKQPEWYSSYDSSRGFNSVIFASSLSSSMSSFRSSATPVSSTTGHSSGFGGGGFSGGGGGGGGGGSW